jgi:hypothetical protein
MAARTSFLFGVSALLQERVNCQSVVKGNVEAITRKVLF